MLHSSPRDKKRHIVSYDLPRNWEVFSYPVELWATRHRLVATCGKMPKGILLIARTIHQEIRKDIFSMWDSPSFLGSLFLSRRTVELLAQGSQLLAVRCQRASYSSLVQFQSRFQSYSLSRSQSDRFLI